MITNSFIFLEKITAARERKLWRQGILSWDDFLRAKEIKGISAAAKKYYDRKIVEARRQLHLQNSSYFCHLLPQTEHWRLYEFFKEEAVYIDIETDGLSDNNDVTMVGLFDGFDTKTMIRRVNLDWQLLRKELQKYKIVVTFNGSVFDLPFMQRRYGKIIPEIPHYDLRFCCGRVGLNGGLKAIEKKFNIRRSEIVESLYGGDAVQLYRMWRGSGDDYYLNLLVEYNEEDVINLKKIAEYVYNELKVSLITATNKNSSTTFLRKRLIKKTMKETSAGAIIFRINGKSKKPRYLLLHYGAGHWDFVKGHIKGSETEKETLLREAKEESGLTDLKLISGFRHKISYFYKKDGETIAKDVIFLLAKTAAAEKDVKLSFEHSEYVWLGFDDAVKKVTYSSSKDVLKKADRFLNEFRKQKRLQLD